MATPETNYPAPQFQESKGNPEKLKEAPKAEIGTVVTVQFLDTNATTQFLITHEEREPEELSSELQTQLPQDVKLARAATPLARAVIGKPAGDEILELVVQRTRPLKIIEVKALVI